MKKTILLVDDNKDLRYSVVMGLKSLGSSYDIVEAEGGRKAMQVLRSQPVDLVLLDIMMPEIDGWEVASQCKSDAKLKKVPISCLTAKTDDFSKGMGKITSEDYIVKPFEITDLKRRIDKVLKA